MTRSAGATAASSHVLATTVMLSRGGISARIPSDGSTAVTHSSRSASGFAWRPAPAPTSMRVLRGERYGATTSRNPSPRALVERAKVCDQRPPVLRPVDAGRLIRGVLHGQPRLPYPSPPRAAARFVGVSLAVFNI